MMRNTLIFKNRILLHELSFIQNHLNDVKTPFPQNCVYHLYHQVGLFNVASSTTWMTGAVFTCNVLVSIHIVFQTQYHFSPILSTCVTHRPVQFLEVSKQHSHPEKDCRHRKMWFTFRTVVMNIYFTCQEYYLISHNQ